MESPVARRWSTERPAHNLTPDSLCVAPWVSLEFDPAGWVYACCANQLYPVGRIGEDRLVDLWSGPRIQVLRDAMDRWDSSIGCATCRWHLEHGRIDTDAAVYDRFAEVLGGDDVLRPPSTMTFALSNRCNLGCVMCTPELSSTLRHKAGLAQLPVPYDDAFFKDLEEFLPHLRYAKFLGGEPFLITEHHRVWELMDRVGGPERIQVTTNGTIWNDRVEWLLDRFEVDVTVSIDGSSAATYESIRSGSKFSTVVRNIERFAEACSSRGTELRLCFCLMAQNAHELCDVLSWADRLGAPVSVNLVTDHGFSLHHLPLDRLDELAEQWARSTPPQGLNRSVWDVQVAQMEQVRSEARGGQPPAPRQSVPLLVGFLGSVVGDTTTSADPALVGIESQRLAAWSWNGSVASIGVGPEGRITWVGRPRQQLGITDALVGRLLDDLGAELEAASGRAVWAADSTSLSTSVAVRTLVLSDDPPVRGGSGLILRLVSVRTSPHEIVVLVGEDRIYERREPSGTTPVEVRIRPGVEV